MFWNLEIRLVGRRVMSFREIFERPDWVVEFNNYEMELDARNQDKTCDIQQVFFSSPPEYMSSKDIEIFGKFVKNPTKANESAYCDITFWMFDFKIKLSEEAGNRVEEWYRH